MAVEKRPINRRVDERTPAARSKKKRRRKRAASYMLYYILLVLVVLAAGVILSMTVFFNLDTIEVTGCDRYAKEQIIEASGIQIGDNLFKLNKGKIEDNLLKQFPYIKSVQIKRGLPSTVTLKITQEIPVGAIQTQSGYTVISEDAKVLEKNISTAPDGVAVIKGFGEITEEVGQYVNREESEWFIMLQYLNEAIEKTEFTGITSVDLSDRLNICLIYEDRIRLELGSESDLEYKLTFCKKIIETELDPNFEGVLDASKDKEVRSREEDIHAQEEVTSPPDSSSSSSDSSDENIDPSSSSDVQSEKTEDSSQNVAA